MPNPLLMRKLYSVPQRLHLTATTTGAAETVTITRLTISRASRIHWGDGQSQVIAANSGEALTHVYAAAGTYKIAAENALYVTGLKLDSAKLGGLNTAELRRSAVNYFLATAITGSTVRSADMTAWRPSTWYLYSVPAGTCAINSADMTAWRPTTWYLSMPAGTFAVNSADMAAWTPTTWYLFSMPAGTYAIDSADMATWTPTNWHLFSMPAGTFAVNSADMATWTPTNWRLSSMPAAGSSYTFAASCMRNWTGANAIRADGLGLDAPTVDAILADVYAGKAAFTYASPSLNVGGTNAAPSGVYGSVCPPTTGKETAYDLANGICVAAGPEWAVTFTA